MGGLLSDTYKGGFWNAESVGGHIRKGQEVTIVKIERIKLVVTSFRDERG
jgi:membrane-bound ClpP family serine protease